MEEEDDDEDDEAGAEWRDAEPSKGVLSRRNESCLSDESRSELIEAEVLAVELDRRGGSLREASVGETRGYKP